MILSMRLPSGAPVRVRRVGSGPPRESDEVDGAPIFAGRALAALLAGEVVVERGEGRARVVLDPAAVLALSLRDFHALRDVCGRLGVITTRAEDVVCRNCDAAFGVDLTNSAEDVVRGRYDEAAPWERERRWTLPSAVPIARAVRARHVSMQEVTVADVRPYWRALAADAPVRVTPALVRAMGVTALGSVTAAGPIARALARAPDAIWRVVENGFLTLAYDARAFHPQLCPHCGALHELDAPFDREVGEEVAEGFNRRSTEEGPVSGRSGVAPFPDAAEFERRVHRIGKEVYDARGVRGVALRVEPGVPDVDDAGEPLLGCYEPAARGLGGDEFLVTIYFRTFEKMWREDGPFDVDAEIRETIDHELTHHLHHLAGHDPLDEEEREEVRRDLVRTYGRGAVRAAERRVVLRTAGILVAILAVVALGLFLLDRLGVLQ